MCRTLHALLQTSVCALQTLVRILMTIILMVENLARMALQTIYNFISFIIQMVSLIPICCVFLFTAKLKCCICGNGPCPLNRGGGGSDCILSLIVVITILSIFRATGVLDKILYSWGYTKARLAEDSEAATSALPHKVLRDDHTQLTLDGTVTPTYDVTSNWTAAFYYLN